MRTEAKVKSYYEDSKGLSPVDNQLAIENREDYDNAFTRQKRLRREHRESRSRSFGREVIELFDDIKANRDVKDSVRHAKRHYEENAGAYHEQAVKDAEADGVTINFSGDTAKHVIKH